MDNAKTCSYQYALSKGLTLRRINSTGFTTPPNSSKSLPRVHAQCEWSNTSWAFGSCWRHRCIRRHENCLLMKKTINPFH